MGRYFASMYTDGPATRWNVIDRNTQEWVRRFATKEGADEYADTMNGAIVTTLINRLGARLADLLDADHWNEIEPLLLEIDDEMNRRRTSALPQAQDKAAT